MKPIIAVTMGDPGGVGPEIILKTLNKIHHITPSPTQQSFPSPPSRGRGKGEGALLLLIGSREVFEFTGEKLSLPFKIHPVPTLERSLLRENEINFLDVTREAEALYEKTFHAPRPKDEVFAVGEISKWNAALTFSTLKVAAYQGACDLIQGLVTAPIQKEAIRLIDPKFTGHTEYLAKIARTKEFAMMFVSERLRVTLATIHLPLKKVAAALKTEGIVEKIVLTEAFLKQRLKIKAPKIGVAALNPHGSEFGTEEAEIIRPAVEHARKQGIRVEGPLSGDQIFYECYHGRLDAVIAMYHDQGLAPFKMIAFDEGVNVTLGLPYLRTSPDHGTAFDIAYQNRANPTAFSTALQFTERMLT